MLLYRSGSFLNSGNVSRPSGCGRRNGSYSFVVKQPLTTDLIKRAAGIEKGAANPKTDKAGTLTKDKLREVAKLKMADLNTADEDMAMRIVAGAARSMGVRIED